MYRMPMAKVMQILHFINSGKTIDNIRFWKVVIYCRQGKLSIPLDIGGLTTKEDLDKKYC